MTFERTDAFRVPADEVEELLANHAQLQPAHARSEADRIIAQATREAERMTEEAIAKREDAERYLHHLAEETLRAYVDGQRIETEVKAVSEILSVASQMRSDFEAMGPWLEELLVTCLHRIAGAVGDRAMISGILRTAMAEMWERDGLVIRVRPVDGPMLADLIEAEPMAFAAVETVVEDERLAAGEIELTGTGGLIQVGLRTQIEALTQRLRSTAAQPEETGEVGPENDPK